MKKYNKAPLPFQGQKRNFIKIFNRELKKLCDDGDGWTIIDVFGGSGLLAHNAKYTCRKARVIYNDYDDFQSRLSRISETEQIRKELLSLTKDIDKDNPIPLEIKNKIIDYLKNKEKEREIDYLTISSYLIYSGNLIRSVEDESIPRNLYHRIPLNTLDCKGYLTGVEIVRKCFTELMKEKINGKVLYLLDPPYINTQQGYFRNNNHYFGLLEQLKLFDLIKPSFFYFTSSKSEIMNIISSGYKYSEIFNHAKTFKTTNTVTGLLKYQDILIIKTNHPENI